MNQTATMSTINPSDETIHLGPLQIRFLVTSDDSAEARGLKFTVPCRRKTSRAGF